MRKRIYKTPEKLVVLLYISTQITPSTTSWCSDLNQKFFNYRFTTEDNSDFLNRVQLFQNNINETHDPRSSDIKNLSPELLKEIIHKSKLKTQQPESTLVYINLKTTRENTNIESPENNKTKNLTDFDFIGRMIIEDKKSKQLGTCTINLLKGGEYALTAYHCLTFKNNTIRAGRYFISFGYGRNSSYLNIDLSKEKQPIFHGFDHLSWVNVSTNNIIFQISSDDKNNSDSMTIVHHDTRLDIAMLKLPESFSKEIQKLGNVGLEIFQGTTPPKNQDSFPMKTEDNIMIVGFPYLKEVKFTEQLDLSKYLIKNDIAQAFSINRNQVTHEYNNGNGLFASFSSIRGHLFSKSYTIPEHSSLTYYWNTPPVFNVDRYPGDSGGAILVEDNKKLKVIGVLTGAMTENKSVSACGLEYIQEVIQTEANKTGKEIGGIKPIRNFSIHDEGTISSQKDSILENVAWWQNDRKAPAKTQFNIKSGFFQRENDKYAVKILDEKSNNFSIFDANGKIYLERIIYDGDTDEFGNYYSIDTRVVTPSNINLLEGEEYALMAAHPLLDSGIKSKNSERKLRAIRYFINFGFGRSRIQTNNGSTILTGPNGWRWLDDRGEYRKLVMDTVDGDNRIDYLLNLVGYLPINDGNIALLKLPKQFTDLLHSHGAKGKGMKIYSEDLSKDNRPLSDRLSLTVGHPELVDICYNEGIYHNGNLRGMRVSKFNRSCKLSNGTIQLITYGQGWASKQKNAFLSKARHGSFGDSGAALLVSDENTFRLAGISTGVKQGTNDGSSFFTYYKKIIELVSEEVEKSGKSIGGITPHINR